MMRIISTLSIGPQMNLITRKDGMIVATLIMAMFAQLRPPATETTIQTLKIISQFTVQVLSTREILCIIITNFYSLALHTTN